MLVQGMVTLALSTWIPGLQPPHEGDSANWIQNLALYGSLYIVALGTGGIKPNVSAFGADQFDMSNPKVCQVSREKSDAENIVAPVSNTELCAFWSCICCLQQCN